MRRITITILLLVFGLLVIGGIREAEAAPILGGIGFASAFFPSPTPGTARVTDVSGDSALALSAGDLFAYNDFNPSTGQAGLSSGGGFTFNLAGSNIGFQNSNGLVLSGGGTVSGNGFDPTPATRNTFASSSTISTVPEPTSLLLLGVGLLTGGLGVARRHR